MQPARRIPVVAYGAAAVVASIVLPVLAMAAWRSFVWQTPGAPDAVASLWRLTAVAGALGLLVLGQLVLLVERRRELADAAGDAARLEAATRRTLLGTRVAAAIGALAVLTWLGVSAAVARRSGVAGPSFAVALALLAGPAVVALGAPAWFVRLSGAAPAELVRASRMVRAGTLVAAIALAAVLIGASAGFAGAQSACQPGGTAALCAATNASMGQVVGLIGPAVVLPSLAMADRAIRALWDLGAAER